MQVDLSALVKDLGKELAQAIAVELRKTALSPAKRWPELMSIERDQSPAAVKALLHSKTIPSCRIDRRPQIRRIDLDRLIERHTH